MDPQVGRRSLLLSKLQDGLGWASRLRSWALLKAVNPFVLTPIRITPNTLVEANFALWTLAVPVDGYCTDKSHGLRVLLLCQTVPRVAGCLCSKRMRRFT
ncbi:hypothetical protein HNP00_003912 [Arthrobacter sp. AZCC_0090]|nr:hypothetical protein [Arthrobacter sp. AZCC_0090]